MTKQHSKQSKEDAVHYYESHKELGAKGCANNLDIGQSTLTKRLKEFRDNEEIVVRGSGNYSSDEQKEITSLKSELKDTQDALDVLKKL
ncbi:transposase [Clostridium gelidum]|uniref:Transposase n=1 Tax=Clostridium gelidum TaxID=704125 RepID=A0ABN6J124_9CLOT|nr:transposase [Clostridium gelidum]BCZ47090.1 transposase [Clostridium gelidum]